ncbi:MAG: dihydrofolate reductase [Erysipelotrichaceae bacterium]
MISLIVAHDEARGIGCNGWMPWDLKEDLALFKATTIGKKIVMGRTTFEGIGKPLPKRFTYVASTTYEKQLDPAQASVCDDLVALLQAYEHSEEELIVCGGAKIYEQALPFVSRFYLSVVSGTYSADTYFPSYDLSNFTCIVKREYEGFTFYQYDRK